MSLDIKLFIEAIESHPLNYNKIVEQQADKNPKNSCGLNYLRHLSKNEINCPSKSLAVINGWTQYFCIFCNFGRDMSINARNLNEINF